MDISIEKCDKELDNNNSVESNITITTNTAKFYTKAQQYWSTVEPTVNGMLGGLGHISSIDIQGSVSFLRHFKFQKYQRALDCGAGIGRVSRDLLCPRFEKVDIVEQDAAFTAKIKDFIPEKYKQRVGEIHTMGLQDFEPTSDTYDLVWSQWVLGHLTDVDLIQFFQRIKSALHKNDASFFIIKENVTSNNEVSIDETDSSVTRPLKHYERILKEAGFKVIKIEKQQSLPKGLFPVYMIASKPIFTK